MKDIVSDAACTSTPPGLRDRVLAVITVAYAVIVAAGISRSKNTLAVHIPNFTGFAYRVSRIHIRLQVRGIQVVVTDRLEILARSGTNRRPKSCTRFPIHTSPICRDISRWGYTGCQTDLRCEKERYKEDKMFFHNIKIFH